MPIPLPALDARAPEAPDVLQQYGRMVALKSMADRAAAQQAMLPGELQNQTLRGNLLTAQAANANADLQATQRQRAQTDAINDAYHKAYAAGTFDPAAFQSELAGAGYGSAIPGALSSVYKVEAAQQGLQKEIDAHRAASQAFFQKLAQQLDKSGQDPLVANWALNTAAGEGYNVAQYGSLLKSNPSAFWNAIHSMAQGNPQVVNEESEASNARSGASRAETAAAQEKLNENLAPKRVAAEEATAAAAEARAANSEGGKPAKASRGDFLRVEQAKQKALAAAEAKYGPNGTVPDTSVTIKAGESVNPAMLEKAKQQAQIDYAESLSALTGNKIAPFAVPVSPAAAPVRTAGLPRGGGRRITTQIARQFLRVNGGDKQKAMEMASQYGWR